jgi:uncharacterized membrane protein YdjX (TVP38/TMEM64 family)
MKKVVPIIIISSWIVLILLTFRYNLFNLSIEEIKHYFTTSDIHPMVLFVLIFCVRIFLFIPSSMLIVVGSMFFSPIETIILSLIGMLITETIIYILSRSIFSDQIHQYMTSKYPGLYKDLLSNRKKYLFITVATPVAPTDGACFIAASTNMPYLSYISIVFAGNIPIAILYTLYGNFLLASPWITLCISVPVLIVSITYISIRKKKQKKEKDVSFTTQV